MRHLLTVRSRLTALLLIPVQIACGGGGDGPSAPPAPVATTIAANSATTLSGTAGGAIATPPSVIVRDQSGSPMAGASVGFTVASGGGSVAGSPAVTSSSGVATVGSWTLGTTSGTNTLTASVGSLTPVTFTAIGAAGPAAVVIKTAGDNQTVEDFTPVPVPPAVTVRDANGNPVAGVAVVFAVAAGGAIGSVTGGSQVTDAAGLATVGSWLVRQGTNTLTVTVGTLPAVSFTATATPRAACSVLTPHTLGTTSNDMLAGADCRQSDGTFVDRFSLTIPSPGGMYTFTEMASFNTFLTLHGADGFQIGENDNFESPTSQNSRIKAVLAPASYELKASQRPPATSGLYTLTSAATSANIAGCEVVFITRGIGTDQTLQPTDCSRNGFRSDDMLIFLRQGQTVTMSMTTSVFDSVLQLRDLLDVVVAFDNAPGTNNSQIVFTPPASAFYKVVPSSALQDATGAYTLTIGP